MTKREKRLEVLCFIFGVLMLFFLFCAIIFIYQSSFLVNDVCELGESICLQEYNLTFDSYEDKVLKCKPVVIEYDGIKIDIGE